MSISSSDLGRVANHQTMGLADLPEDCWNTIYPLIMDKNAPSTIRSLSATSKGMKSVIDSERLFKEAISRTGRHFPKMGLAPLFSHSYKARFFGSFPKTLYEAMKKRYAITLNQTTKFEAGIFAAVLGPISLTFDHSVVPWAFLTYGLSNIPIDFFSDFNTARFECDPIALMALRASLAALFGTTLFITGIPALKDQLTPLMYAEFLAILTIPTFLTKQDNESVFSRMYRVGKASVVAFNPLAKSVASSIGQAGCSFAQGLTHRIQKCFAPSWG